MAEAAGREVSWGATLYVCAVVILSRMLLTEVFGLPLPAAFMSAAFLAFFTAYPLFVRGRRNRWSKSGRPWTLRLWGAVAAAAALMGLLVPLLFERPDR